MITTWTADRLLAESNDIRKFYKKGPYKHMFYEDGGKWFVRGQERKEEDLEDTTLVNGTLSFEQLFDDIDEKDNDE